jgi:GNAT superfamily N-acetyltransferase
LPISITIQELAADNWNDLEILFGNKGACGGCWCMTWRLPNKQYQQYKGTGNKKLFHKLVQDGESLGVIGYHSGKPVAWCSVSPAHTLFQQKPSRILSKTSFPGKWSIVCIYLSPNYRNKGVSTIMIKAATRYAFSKGAETVEAYPVIPKNGKMPDVFAWTGIWKSYEKAGFKIVAQPSTGKYIMVKHLSKRKNK